MRNHEEWLLDGEGDTASLSEYLERFKQLNKTYSGYKFRKDEYLKREKNVLVLKEALRKYSEKYEKLATSKSWVTEE